MAKEFDAWGEMIQGHDSVQEKVYIWEPSPCYGLEYLLIKYPRLAGCDWYTSHH